MKSFLTFRTGNAMGPYVGLSRHHATRSWWTRAWLFTISYSLEGHFCQTPRKAKIGEIIQAPTCTALQRTLQAG